MALVEAISFLDRNQAFIARAALIDAGIFAEVRDNGYANMMFGMTIATGGYPVMVLSEDLAAARAFLEAADPADPDALDWIHHPAVLDGIPGAALGAGAALATGAEASMLLGLKRKKSLVNLLMAAVPVTVLLLIFVAFALALRGTF